MKFFFKIAGFILLATIGLLVFRFLVDVSVFLIDLDSFIGFLQIIGVLYGIMAAFVVYVVWERYNKIQEITEKETDSLSELYDLVTYLEDEEINRKIKRVITEYSKAVIERGWRKLSKGQKSNQASAALHKVYEEIKSIKSERKRFPVIFAQIVEKYEDVTDLRTQRVAMSTQHLPKSLKTLILFDSFALILSVYLLPMANIWLAIFITIVVAGTVALTLNVIFDLDDPLAPGEWQLTPKAFEDLIKELKERG